MSNHIKHTKVMAGLLVFRVHIVYNKGPKDLGLCLMTAIHEVTYTFTYSQMFFDTK